MTNVAIALRAAASGIYGPLRGRAAAGTCVFLTGEEYGL